MERFNGKAPALAYGHSSFSLLAQSYPEAYDFETRNKLLTPAQEEGQMDKKLKRIMASRQYSQRYRLKQLQYILHLETEAKALQAHVEIATPRIHYVGEQNSLLRAENRTMKHRLGAYMGEIIFKEAQYEELKKEKENLLKCLYFSYQTRDNCPEYLERSSNIVGSLPSPEEDGNVERN